MNHTLVRLSFVVAGHATEAELRDVFERELRRTLPRFAVDVWPCIGYTDDNVHVYLRNITRLSDQPATAEPITQA